MNVIDSVKKFMGGLLDFNDCWTIHRHGRVRYNFTVSEGSIAEYRADESEFDLPDGSVMLCRRFRQAVLVSRFREEDWAGYRKVREAMEIYNHPDVVARLGHITMHVSTPVLKPLLEFWRWLESTGLFDLPRIEAWVSLGLLVPEAHRCASGLEVPLLKNGELDLRERPLLAVDGVEFYRGLSVDYGANWINHERPLACGKVVIYGQEAGEVHYSRDECVVAEPEGYDPDRKRVVFLVELDSKVARLRFEVNGEFVGHVAAIDIDEKPHRLQGYVLVSPELC